MRRAKAIPIVLPHGPLKKRLPCDELAAEVANETDLGKVGALTSKVVSFVEKQLVHASD